MNFSHFHCHCALHPLLLSSIETFLPKISVSHFHAPFPPVCWGRGVQLVWVGYIYQSRNNLSEATPLMKITFFPQQPVTIVTINSLSGRDGTSWATPSPMMKCGSVPSCASLVQISITAVSSWVVR